MTRRRLKQAFGVTVVVVALASACAPASQQLPTLGGVEPSGGDTQGQTASRLVDCLAQVGVDAYTSPISEYQAFVSFEGLRYSYRCHGHGCETTALASGVTPDRLEQIKDEIDRLLEARFPIDDFTDDLERDLAIRGSHVLLVDGFDWTTQYAACVTESGFVEAVLETDAEYELAEKDALTRAGLAWAKCARDHGRPEVIDPVPPQADGWETQPIALLPAWITDIELRELIDQCPIVFQDESIDPHNPVTAPVGLDAPGFRGRGELTQGSEEEQARLIALMSTIADSTDSSDEPVTGLGLSGKSP
jgi:hypothetical protein